MNAELKKMRKEWRNEEYEAALWAIREDVELLKVNNPRFFAHTTSSEWAWMLYNRGVGVYLTTSNRRTLALRALRTLEREGELTRSIGLGRRNQEATVWHPKGY